MSRRSKRARFAAAALSICCGLACANDWPRRPIGLDGSLKVGAEYANEAGQAHTSGEAQTCVFTYASGNATRSCRQALYPGVEQPVKIVAEFLKNDFILVSIRGEEFHARATDVFLTFKGVRMTMHNFSTCYPPPGRTVTVVGNAEDMPVCP